MAIPYDNLDVVGETGMLPAVPEVASDLLGPSSDPPTLQIDDGTTLHGRPA